MPDCNLSADQAQPGRPAYFFPDGASLLPGFHCGRVSALATASTKRRKKSLNFAAASGSQG